MQEALWELGGVTKAYLTDRLFVAVQNTGHTEKLTQRYGALLRHAQMPFIQYVLTGRKLLFIISKLERCLLDFELNILKNLIISKSISKLCVIS